MNKQTGALENSEQGSSRFWGCLKVQFQIIGITFILAALVVFVLATAMSGVPAVIQGDAFRIADAKWLLIIGVVLFFFGWIGDRSTS